MIKMKGYSIQRLTVDYKSLRIINIILSALALGSGILIYILFRNNTYLSNFDFLKMSTDNNFTDFLKYYFADLLWAFSFCEAINGLVTLYNKKSILIIALSVFLLGAVIEYCQLKNIINGTFDLIDILMYFFGVTISFLLNYKLLKKKRVKL